MSVDTIDSIGDLDTRSKSIPENELWGEEKNVQSRDEGVCIKPEALDKSVSTVCALVKRADVKLQSNIESIT